MVSSAIAGRFGNALVDVVLGPKGTTPEKAVAGLRSFEEVVQSDKALREVLATPAVSAAKKQNIVKKLAEMLALETPIRNFLLVLTKHRRIASLGQVIAVFEKALDSRLGFQHAEIKSAAELTDEEKSALSVELERLAGIKIKAVFHVQPELIGGATAQLGSKVYDGSVRGQLDVLRSRMALNTFSENKVGFGPRAQQPGKVE